MAPIIKNASFLSEKAPILPIIPPEQIPIEEPILELSVRKTSSVFTEKMLSVGKKSSDVRAARSGHVSVSRSNSVLPCTGGGGCEDRVPDGPASGEKGSKDWN